DLGDLAVAADERRPLRGEVRGPGVKGSDRGELRREPLDHKVVEMLGAFDVLQPMPSKVAKGHAVGDVGFDQLSGRFGYQDLAAVPRGGDACGQVDVEPDVVVPPENALPGMQP